MNVLITGGCGYIGSYLAFKLTKIKKIKKIFIIDNLINGKKKFKCKKIKYKHLCFSNNKVKKIIITNKISQIYHLAAFIDNEESVLRPKKYWQNNYFKSVKFLNFCISANVKVFNFASSAAIYGSKTNKKVHENFKKKPLTPYGKTKLDFEKALIKSKKKIKFNIYRFFNVAGADPKNNFGPANKNYKHLLNVITNARDTFTINGNNYLTKDGTCIRDYVHIKDIIKILIKIPKLSYQNNILNVGSGIPSSVKEVYKKFCKYKFLKIINGSRRKGDNAYLVSDNRKLKKLVKIKFIQLDKIIKDLVDYKKL